MILNPTTIEEIKANREEWAAALESGKYKQGRSYLTDGKGGYCCFGVLCELVDPTRTEWEPSNPLPDHYMLYQVGYSRTSQRDDWNIPNGASDLANANDRGTPFPEIAAMIRTAPFPEAVTR